MYSLLTLAKGEGRNPFFLSARQITLINTKRQTDNLDMLNNRQTTCMLIQGPGTFCLGSMLELTPLNFNFVILQLHCITFTLHYNFISLQLHYITTTLHYNCITLQLQYITTILNYYCTLILFVAVCFD